MADKQRGLGWAWSVIKCHEGGIDLCLVDAFRSRSTISPECQSSQINPGAARLTRALDILAKGSDQSTDG